MEKPPGEEQEPSIEERFGEAYEGANIVPVSYDDLPPEVAKNFEGRSALLVPREKYTPRNFSHMYLLTHPDGSKTYIAENIKSFGEGEKDNFVYFVDCDGDTIVGRGEFINHIETNDKDMIGKPYANFTRTYGPKETGSDEKDFRRKGYGQRRIIEMNAYTKARFGYPLHSAAVMTTEDRETGASDPRRIWERLVKEGKAESYTEGKGKDAKICFRMK